MARSARGNVQPDLADLLPELAGVSSSDDTSADDDVLISELTNIRYKYLSTGKLKIESKDELKRRGQRSPDVADAFILTFAGDGAIASGSVSKWSTRTSLKPDLRWVV